MLIRQISQQIDCLFQCTDGVGLRIDLRNELGQRQDRTGELPRSFWARFIAGLEVILKLTEKLQVPGAAFFAAGLVPCHTSDFGLAFPILPAFWADDEPSNPQS